MRPVFFALVFVLACGTDGDKNNSEPDAGFERPSAQENLDHDIERIELELDLANRAGIATITTQSAINAATFDVGDLEIVSVADEHGALNFSVDSGSLHVGAVSGAAFSVSYQFPTKSNFDGWMPESGLTFLWPHFCGNLFPCVSMSNDGFELTAEVTGATATAVFPTEIPANAPSYMFAVAVADYQVMELGSTASGTNVKAWHLANETAATAQGTQNLRGVFEFLEDTYGPYLYGDEVGSVSAAWGPGAFGGMEHHPYWHVGSGAMGDQTTHAHEAAHGWFGNGVRIQCWEDFVLSEGVTSYLAARALSEFDVDSWASYECRLKTICQGASNTTVLPDATCNEINLLEHALWSSAPYMKGAYFLKLVANEIGQDELDQVLADFYSEHQGQATRMAVLIEALREAAAAPAAIDALVNDWLRQETCPDISSLCAGS